MVGFLNIDTPILGIQVKTMSLTFRTGIVLAATDSEILILKFGWSPFMLIPLIALFAFVCLMRATPTPDPPMVDEDQKDPREWGEGDV